MYLIYSLALTLLFLVLLPYFIYQAIRHGKYSGSLKQRLGHLPASLRPDGRLTIWVHTVSVGEFLAARPLIEMIRSELPGWRIVVSTVTATGQRLASEIAPERIDAAFYFPYDWAFAARRALAHVNPRAVVILETELWPNFLRQCRARDITTVVVNGRISPRSFSRYMKVRPFIARALEDASLLVMQSEADAKRARMLGAPAARVRVCGNMKYDLSAPSHEKLQELDAGLSLSSHSRLIVAGSTAPGEEEILLRALARVRKEPGLEDARLLIAPRHPERFDEVAALIEKNGFTLARRSKARPEESDVILLDTVGELACAYSFAAAVFIGGSLVPRGGHNIIEPALFAKPIITGPHTENFRQIVSDFARARAVVEVSESGLAQEIIRLLADRESARAMGERARAILAGNQGATRCAMAALKTAVEREEVKNG
jgi:3-deoxy-D-manno-octulosonic-acid transferase